VNTGAREDYASRVAAIDDFEAAVAKLGPRPLLILGSSLSPDGRYGAALSLLSTAATYYPMNDLFENTAEGWIDHSGGNWDSQWTALGDDSRGVWTLAGKAPDTATVARVAFEGSDHTVAVRHGHFFFVQWDTGFDDEPQLVGFD
jgi:hypothetical protein